MITDAVLIHDTPKFQGMSEHQFNNNIDLQDEDSYTAMT